MKKYLPILICKLSIAMFGLSGYLLTTASTVAAQVVSTTSTATEENAYPQSSTVNSAVSSTSKITERLSELNELGTAHETAGEYGAARAAYEEIFALFTAENIEDIKEMQSLGLFDVESVVESLFLIYWAESAPEKAVAVVSKIVQLQVDHGDLFDFLDTPEEQNSLAISYSETKTGALIAQSLSSNEPGLVRNAFSTVLVRKGRILDAIATAAKERIDKIDLDTQNELNTLYRALADLKLSTAAEDQGQGLSAQETKAEIERLQDRVTQINMDLMQGDSKGFDWLSLPPSGSTVADMIPEGIPENAALIEMVEYSAPDAASDRRRYAAYVMTRQGDLSVVDLGSAQKINTQIVSFRRALESRSASAKTIGRQLDEQITQPIRAQLGDKTHLFISPDSYLNTVPFEAFVDSSGQYLIESYQISYLLSGKDLLKFSKDSRDPEYLSPFTVIANPDYDTSTESDYEAISTAATNRRSADFETLMFSNLPGTQQEAASIELIQPDAIFLTQDEPTESIVKQIQRPFMLHFATHGFFLSDSTAGPMSGDDRSASLDVISTETERPFSAESVENPLLRSGLALTGVNNHQGSREDGILTALEVSEMDLHGTELVVLSACETGLGVVSSGEGIYGMRRAFSMAGAASQVMSLWQVDDTGTSELMSMFYQNLIQNQQGRSEALRNAQLALLNTGTYAHPYYWSSFILSGNWQAFEAPPPKEEAATALDAREGITSENFQLSTQISEYRKTRAWRDNIRARMLELEDQRRYEELALLREDFNRVMDSRTDPDLFKVSRSLLYNLNFRVEDLYIQQRYAEAIEVVETMIDIQQSGIEENVSRFDMLISLQTLAAIHRKRGDDIAALLTYNRALSAYEDTYK